MSLSVARWSLGDQLYRLGILLESAQERTLEEGPHLGENHRTPGSELSLGSFVWLKTGSHAMVQAGFELYV